MSQPYTVGFLEQMCHGIDQLAHKLTTGPLPAQEEAACALEVVQVVQRMGEGMAWAYNTHQHTGLGEQFAQPFLDRHIRERLKELLVNTRTMRLEPRNQVAAQILQTIHILLQATPSDSTLFCSLTAGWYLNDIVSAPLDFRENEDLLPLWMTVVKDIASMISRDNLMLFFDPGSTATKQFPIFTEAIKYYHHPVAQVRTHVQAISLDIFLKFRDEEMWNEPLFQLVLAESSAYFTHVCCLLRDFWKMADDAVRSGAKRDARNAIYIQNDILMYINDVFSCEIPQITAILQEKLLKFAVLPVLVRSVVRPSDFIAVDQIDKVSLTSEATSLHKDYLTTSTAWYFLYDVLCTLRSRQVLTMVGLVLLRTELPEEVLRAAMAPPPRTPTMYLTLQSAWGSPAVGGGFASSSQLPPDADLYATPPVPLVSMLEVRRSSSQRNTLPDVLNSVVLGVVADCSASKRTPAIGSQEPQGPRAPLSVLGVVALLLKSIREGDEPLAQVVVEKLGSALCNLLDLHRVVEWPLLESGLKALQELFLASNTPSGRASQLLGPALHHRLLASLAALLQKEAKQARGPSLDPWLLEFEEQWLLHLQGVESPSLASLQRELLEQGSVSQLTSVSHRELTFSRRHCLLLALHARRIQCNLAAQPLPSPPQQPLVAEGSSSSNLRGMPGYSDQELEESKTFKPGVSVHIDRMKRLKCQVIMRGVPEELMYLIGTETLLVLVKPDDLKAFNAVPVIVEPFRHICIKDAQSGRTPLETLQLGAALSEPKHRLVLEVSRPASPFFHPSRNPARTGAPNPGPGGSLGHRLPDGSELGLGSRAGKRLATRPGTAEDPLSTSVPCLPVLQEEEMKPVLLSLCFAEERRVHIANMICERGKTTVSQRMSDGIDKFLASLHSEVIADR